MPCIFSKFNSNCPGSPDLANCRRPDWPTSYALDDPCNRFHQVVGFHPTTLQKSYRYRDCLQVNRSFTCMQAGTLQAYRPLQVRIPLLRAGLWMGLDRSEGYPRAGYVTPGGMRGRDLATEPVILSRRRRRRRRPPSGPGPGTRNGLISGLMLGLMPDIMPD